LLESAVDLLDRFEALLKNIVDGGILGRLARTVQPAEIARRLATEMEFNYGRGFVGPTGRIAPNDFTVTLNPEDFREYEPNQEALEAYLARYLEDIATRQGISLLGPCSVHLAAEQRQSRHTLAIESKVSGSASTLPPLPTPSRAAPAPRKAVPPARPRAGASSYLVDLTSGAKVPLGDQPVKLGRALENTLVASNEFVSRAHAEIRPKHGRYFVRDLGSRNGTFVNGKKVSAEQELAVNDTITLGPDPVGQRYRFVRAEVGA
jgi:hypothetical protein